MPAVLPPEASPRSLMPPQLHPKSFGRLVMSLPQTILDLENRSLGKDGEPTLGRALALTLELWRSGSRSRELRLHLLFLSWYCNLEPPHLTGFTASAALDLSDVFHEVYSSFDDDILEDAEILFVIGLMGSLTPWALGDSIGIWEERARSFRARYRRLTPEGISPDVFAGRGAYGDYFADQVAVSGGF